MESPVKTNVKRNTEGKAKKVVGKVFLYAFLILLAVVSFLPFFIMLIDCTHSNAEIATKLWIIPGSDLIANYHRLIANENIWQGFLNSLIVATSITIVSGYASAVVAYGFSRYKFKGNGVLYMVVLATMMIPGQLGIIGMYQLMTKLHLVNNFLSLILPSIANASSVFFIKGYTDGAVHESLIEAARIDGAKEFPIFNKIALPLMIPSVATMSIFTFINTWNNYLTPLILMQDSSKYTLPIMIVAAKGVYKTDFGAIYTGVAISVVPIMIAFIAMSKKIVGGLTIGGVKG